MNAIDSLVSLIVGKWLAQADGLWNGVISAFGPGVTSRYPAQSHPHSSHAAVFIDRLRGILGTGGHVAACPPPEAP